MKTNKLDLDEVMEAVEADDLLGFCTECGEIAYGVEPDAREYECEVCEARAVYGAEECLLWMAV